MWVDSDTDQDLVNYRGIAQTVTNLILTPHMSPLTIGIHGDWGYGKSSVLRMVQKQLAENKKVLSLSFNGWAFEGFEDAKIALMDSILCELAKSRAIVEKAKDEIIALAKRVRWFKVARKVASVALTLSTGIPDFSDLIAGASEEDKDGDSWLKEAQDDAAFRHIVEFRVAFEAAIKKADIDRLVVFVDDLDRCLPDTAIGTLEAIRLFLSVPNSVFVIGADETMIEYSVRRHFPELTKSAGSDKFTRNYLEKLIQIPVRLPQLTAGETRRFITLLLIEDALRSAEGAFEAVLAGVAVSDKEPWKEIDLDQIVQAALKDRTLEQGVLEKLRERVTLAAQIARPLADKYVGNPRQIKRFLNTLMMRIAVAEAYGLANTVHLGSLAKLMLLERREVEAYTALSRAAAESKDGKVGAVLTLERAVRAHDEAAANEAVEGVFGKQVSEWVMSWAAIDPPLGEHDLRPYLFVSRERLAQFVGGDELSSELQGIVELFATGDRFKVTSRLARIGELTAENASSVLEALIERTEQKGDYQTQPGEFRAIDSLLDQRPRLELRMLGFLETLPVSKLGSWAPVFAVASAKSVDGNRAVGQLIERWAKQKENAPLAKAAEVATVAAKATKA